MLSSHASSVVNSTKTPRARQNESDHRLVELTAATCIDGGMYHRQDAPTVAVAVEPLLINVSTTVGGISTTAEAELGVGGRDYTDTKKVKVRLSIASLYATNYIRIIPNYYYLYLFIIYR